MMRMIAAIVLGFLCASPAWATNLKRFMLIGDSIQSGIGVTNAAALAANLLADGASVVVHNFSSPGARMTDGGPFPGFTHDGLCVQQVYGTSSFPLNGVIITLGTNDWTGGVDGTTFINAYTALLNAIPAGVPAVCVSPIWRSDEGTPNATSGLVLDHFRWYTAFACQQKGFPQINGSNLVPHDRAYYSEPAPAAAVHPNDLGQMAMATNLRQQLTAIGWLP